MNFIENETEQKLRGGYYTPLDLAVFLADWVKEISPRRILEPSCGDGIFFDALAKVGGVSQVDITGFELEENEAAKALERSKSLGLSSVTVYPEDFLQWALGSFGIADRQFDAVLGNPPFVRYQYLPEQFQVRAERIFKEFGLPFTKHTNAWVPFVLASIALLRPGGRLAMVIPSEIIHVTHAQSLRTYLSRECQQLVIVDPEELWFSDTLQGAVILMAEKKSRATDVFEGVGIYPVKGREFLRLAPSTVFGAPEAISGKSVQAKWTRALLDHETRVMLEELVEHKELHKFDNVATVDVGIVTGANKFFLVSDEVVENFDLQKWAHPMFGRSEHCPGVIYDAQQHAANATRGSPTNFLWFREDEHRLEGKAKAYIEAGEEQGLHTRYKCRIRKPWYTVPSVYATEIGMLKRSHDTPRLITNRVAAYTTDTAYRVRTLGVDANKLVGCFINPITALSAELEGRHYGGGVLELVPSEIERLLIPLPAKVTIDVENIDKLIRTQPTYDVLAFQNRAILAAMGLSLIQQECMLEGWRKMRDRRHRVSSEIAADLG